MELLFAMEATLSKFQGHLITIISSTFAILTFFFLPYLAVTFPGGGSESLTGLQMIGINAQSSPDSDSLIHSFPMLWVQPALMALVLLIAVIQLVKLSQDSQRNEMAAQRGALWELIVGGFILLMLLCRYLGDASSMIAIVGASTTRDLS